MTKPLVRTTFSGRIVSRFVDGWAIVRAALAGSEPDFTRGPIGRAVILLAIPMMLEMAMESIFAVVDIFFVSRLGADAVAAVGLTEAMLMPLYAIAVGLSTGATAMISRRIGAHDPEAAAKVAGQTIWIGLLVSLVIGSGGLLLADDFLRLMGASAAVIEIGSGYTQLMLGGAFNILFLFLLNGAFRGAGDATVAMRALWLANGLNIVLDPCLIFGWGPFPELGVTGAAVATNIGRGVGVLYQLWYLTGGRARFTLRWHHLALQFALFRRLFEVSAGGILQFLIATSSWIFLVRIISPYGSEAVAGYTIGLRMLELTFLPAWGMGGAAATLVGQNLGAGQPDRAAASVWCAARFNAVFLTTMAIIFFVFAEPLVRIFTSDPVVLEYGRDCVRIIACGFSLFAVGTVMIQALNGAGDTYTPGWINAICFWVVQIPLALWLAENLAFGPQGVFVAIAVAESLVAVLGIWVVRRGRWKLREV